MKIKAVIVLGITLFACLTASCHPSEPRETIVRWLRSRTGPVGMDIGGAWTDTDWGSCYFRQNGSYVTGKVGDYVAYGRINGCVLSLSLWYNGAQYYTATLTLDRPGLLVGKYYRTTLQQTGWPMMLRQHR